MRFFIFVFVFLSSSILSSALSPLSAIAAESAAPSPKNDQQRIEQVQANKTTPKKEARPTKKPGKNPLPTTFQPTEKIDADTVIAFPADI